MVLRKTTALVEQKYRCRMIHRIFAIFARNLLGVDVVGFDHISNILWCTGDANDAVGNVADIGLHDFLRVAFRINGDEISLDVTGFRPKLLQPAIKLIERGGADVRAMGEAEKIAAGAARKSFSVKGVPSMVTRLSGPPKGSLAASLSRKRLRPAAPTITTMKAMMKMGRNFFMSSQP